MLELVLVYCMVGTPDRCVERREPLTEIDDGAQCMLHGEIEATRFVAAHPQWRLFSWRCAPDSTLADPA